MAGDAVVVGTVKVSFAPPCGTFSAFIGLLLAMQAVGADLSAHYNKVEGSDVFQYMAGEIGASACHPLFRNK